MQDIVLALSVDGVFCNGPEVHLQFVCAYSIKRMLYQRKGALWQFRKTRNTRW